MSGHPERIISDETTAPQRVQLFEKSLSPRRFDHRFIKPLQKMFNSNFGLIKNQVTLLCQFFHRSADGVFKYPWISTTFYTFEMPEKYQNFQKNKISTIFHGFSVGYPPKYTQNACAQAF